MEPHQILIILILCIFAILAAVITHDKIVNGELITLEIKLLGNGWDCQELEMFLDKANEAILFKIDKQIQEVYDERECMEAMK